MDRKTTAAATAMIALTFTLGMAAAAQLGVFGQTAPTSANGVRFAPGGIRRGAAGHDVCFIHPRGHDAHHCTDHDGRAGDDGRAAHDRRWAASALHRERLAGAGQLLRALEVVDEVDPRLPARQLGQVQTRGRGLGLRTLTGRHCAGRVGAN